jgi:hypothetical protein
MTTNNAALAMAMPTIAPAERRLCVAVVGLLNDWSHLLVERSKTFP